MQETFTIEVPRPRTIADLETVRREAADRAYTKAVLDLVGQGELSSAYGAKLLGMNRIDFVECMRHHGLPLADYPGQVLHQEIENATQDFIERETDQA